MRKPFHKIAFLCSIGECCLYTEVMVRRFREFFGYMNRDSKFPDNHKPSCFGNFAKKLKNSFSKQTKGAILLEFAFCIPIMIAVVFYALDSNRLAFFKRRTEFVAYEIANMIQNIHKNDGKPITKTDLRNIIVAASHAIFPGTTFFRPKKDFMNYGLLCQIYYVKGLDNGNASCLWRIHVGDNGVSTKNPSTVVATTYSSDYSGSSVRFKTNVAPSQIYPSLKINPGEVKIIIDLSLVSDKSTFSKKTYGFYLITPHFRVYSSYSFCFNSVVILTPNPGLFSESTSMPN